MPTLFHYSTLFHLPPILSSGLSVGEIASFTAARRSGVNLTTQTDPHQLNCWGGGQNEPKKAVRYRCEVAADDPLLRPARAVWRDLGVTPRQMRALDPRGESKWWSVYFGVIPMQAIGVELRGRNGYVAVGEPDTARIATEVAILRDRFEFIVPPDEPWALDLRLKDPTDPSPFWVLREAYPADRFLARPPV
ncbi:hypothetical protein [Limnoglobus roseus]|uniref:Uncharacterized protein n=1 Tax=Limnoglobus roseus TaxID=2598579 RepID=A0A5C1AIQ7_9BACT|nr:hypothetical protein [Limnoglobus roseus]QEL16858.1 hypothetical protein PX52LOC_03832 [Limnoglobus roseus]